MEFVSVTHGAARQLVVTWQHPKTRSIHPVGFLSLNGGRYGFHYIRHALQVEGFRPLLGFPSLDHHYDAEELFPLFAQRVMDPRRPDYQRYVTQLGLDADSAPWEQISRSGGRRQGDLLQLLPAPHCEGSTLSLTFLVSGLRHMAGRSLTSGGEEVVVTAADHEHCLRRLAPGDELVLVDDPTNDVNPEAMLTCAADRTPLGYVPDVLVEDVRELRRVANVRTTCAVVNDDTAPWHLRLLARLTASDAGDFRFFTGSRWQSIS